MVKTRQYDRAMMKSRQYDSESTISYCNNIIKLWYCFVFIVLVTRYLHPTIAFSYLQFPDFALLSSNYRVLRFKLTHSKAIALRVFRISQVRIYIFVGCLTLRCTIASFLTIVVNVHVTPIRLYCINLTKCPFIINVSCVK